MPELEGCVGVVLSARTRKKEENLKAPTIITTTETEEQPVKGEYGRIRLGSSSWPSVLFSLLVVGGKEHTVSEKNGQWLVVFLF